MGMSVSTAVCKRVTHGHASGSLWEQREHQAGVFRECGGWSGAKTIISADAEWSRLCWRLEGDNPGNTTTLQAPANPSDVRQNSPACVPRSTFMCAEQGSGDPLLKNVP